MGIDSVPQLDSTCVAQESDPFRDGNGEFPVGEFLPIPVPSTHEEAGEEGEALPTAAVVVRQWGDAVAEASRRRSKKVTSAHLLEGPHETDEMQKQKHRGGKQRQHETDKNDDTSFSISISGFVHKVLVIVPANFGELLT